MDREHLSRSLVTWLQTFKVEGRQETVEDLSDGVTMSLSLHQIAPKFFSDAWVAKIKTDAANNWRLKVSNLKKVLKGILDYYSEVLGQQIQDFHMPDVNAIGEHSDSLEMGRLLQLILGCAVNCDDKQSYIQKIMGMEESVQHVVMQAIQELMTKETSTRSEGYSEVGEQLKRTVEELNRVAEQKDEIAQRCHELDLQVATTQEEKLSLLAEIDRLNERLNQADSLDDTSVWEDWPEFLLSTPAGRRYQQLQNQVEQLQDDLYRLEAARDDYKIKVELQERELAEVQQKNEDLTSLAEEARTMKDEMDILKHTSDKVAKFEGQIESYKKKLEELSDLKGQIRLLEEKNTTYMQSNMDLEEEVRKIQPLKSQLDMYKRQVQELQMKGSDETKRADKAEFEGKRLQEKMQALQREKERLVEERDSLRETNEELRCAQVQQETMTMNSTLKSVEADILSSGDGTDALPSPGGFELMALPPEVREKFIRLQHENRMLKLQKADTESEQGQLLQSMLDDANTRNNELQSEVRILNQRMLELNAQIEDMRENQESSSQSRDEAGVEMRKSLTEQIEKNKVVQLELQNKTTQVEELETKLQTGQERTAELEERLSRKEDEMKAMEDRYKRYLEKAKSVIRTLDPKHNTGSAPEIQTLRNQLQEKDRLIEHLERDHDKAKSVREEEEKLIVTAWYNLGMQLHRKAAEERLTNSGAGQSFLARQRQAHTRRNQCLASPHAAGVR